MHLPIGSEILPLFLDSNVIVGYQLAPVHRLANPAENVITGDEPCWWSRRVILECYGDDWGHGVCNTQFARAQQEFRRLSFQLKRNPDTVFSPAQFPIIGKMVFHYQQKHACSASDLDVWVTQYKDDFVGMYKERMQHILEVLHTHTREMEYPSEKMRIISQINERRIELDLSDVEIWIDAHDLACTVDQIVFVSDNSRHVSAAADIICSCTRIAGIRELTEFQNH